MQHFTKCDDKAFEASVLFKKQCLDHGDLSFSVSDLHFIFNYLAHLLLITEYLHSRALVCVPRLSHPVSCPVSWPHLSYPISCALCLLHPISHTPLLTSCLMPSLLALSLTPRLSLMLHLSHPVSHALCLSHPIS